MNARNLHSEISEHECIAMRELYRGDYTHSELAFMFECKDSTVARHVNKECHHNNVDSTGYTIDNPKKEYSDSELLNAFRRVYDRQPYERMSQSSYDEHRKDSQPAATTIHNRFGSWPEARRLAHNG